LRKCADARGQTMLCVMFAHDEPRWAGTEDLEHTIELFLAIRRVDETQICSDEVSATSSRPGDHTAPHQAAALAATQTVRRRRDAPERRPGPGDRRRRSRPPPPGPRPAR